MEITWNFLILAVLIVAVNPLVIRKIIRNSLDPNVWDGKFEIVLDNGQTIPGSFEKEYGINGIDIPKGRLIKELIIKSVPEGFVPMLGMGQLKTRLITGWNDFPERARSVDLCFEVINPRTLPPVFGFAVASNQRIAHGEKRSTELHFPNFDINIWYDRPGAE